MKLISLNIWGGIVYEPLIDFIKKQSKDTDIFCFQEMIFGKEAGFTSTHQGRINLFSEIEKVLPDFKFAIFKAPQGARFQSEILPEGVRPGQAIFYKNLDLIKEGGLRGYEGELEDWMPKVTGSFQWAEFKNKDKSFLLVNIHGLWEKGSNKADTPRRLVQSKILRDFSDKQDKPFILTGDFNLAPDTESIEIITDGLDNLIKESEVTTTRTHYYEKEARFADYMFTSPEIKVSKFEVMQDVVSDHLPLLLEFE